MNDRLRIGDADRETAARALGEHYALGRISAEEHAERLEQIWAARTEADLAPAFRDLPRPPARRERAGRRTALPSASRRTRGWRPEIPHIPFPLKVLVAVVVLWWGFHHPLFLVIGVAVYVVLIRRLVQRRRWRGRSGSDPGSYQTGWH